MRLLKPLLTAAAVLSIAAPAATALADPYWGYGHERHYEGDQGYRDGDYWRQRQAAREHAWWRWREHREYREHRGWDHRDGWDR
ncbi:MAG: hypothetical protein P4L64_09085 [Caulobacteraceae bacterium]|nr:hypothetical protein [Caulobacteraceae bacterium]